MDRLENLKNIIMYLMADEHVSHQIPSSLEERQRMMRALMIVWSSEGVTVSGIGIGCHSLTQHVHHPVGGLSAVDECVECPSGCPHDVRASLVVLRIHVSLAAADDK